MPVTYLVLAQVPVLESVARCRELSGLGEEVLALDFPEEAGREEEVKVRRFWKLGQHDVGAKWNPLKICCVTFTHPP